MMAIQENSATAVSRQAIQAFDRLNGPQPGFRPAHAKGILLTGMFTPSPDAADLSQAPHLQRATAVTVRFSDFAGIPKIADNNGGASPRGMAVRFHLGEHSHTDIIAHSVNGFPTRTAEEFVQFLTAAYESSPSGSNPGAMKEFLEAKPAALDFVQRAKPFPTSFARESFYGVTAYKFTNLNGAVRYGRYRIHPKDGGEYHTDDQASTQSPNYLFEEIADRLAKSSVELSIFVQLATEDDVTDDSTVQWPEDRAEVKLGTVEISAIVPDNEAAQRHIIFDPIPRVDGIEPSADPLLEPRATLYLMSGRRRRTEQAAEPEPSTGASL